MLTTFLSTHEVRLLEGFQLQPRRTFTGRQRGERLTKRKGISIEFADYRDYNEGDDLRHLDWNVLARLQSPVIKTYQDEEDTAVHLIVDCSPSMAFGDPTKLFMAQRLACAFGYVALGGGDAAYPRSIGTRSRSVGALRGRPNYARLTRWMEELTLGGKRALSEELRELARADLVAGMVFVFTDGLDPDLPRALRVLAGRGHEVSVVQILCHDELNPDLEGDLRLIDSETGEAVEITANQAALAEYQRRLSEHLGAIKKECTSVGGRHAVVTPQTSFERLFKDIFPRGGWVVS